MQVATKKYRISVIVKTLEIYEIEAENADEAEETWYEGTLIDTDDGWTTKSCPSRSPAMSPQAINDPIARRAAVDVALGHVEQARALLIRLRRPP